MLSPRVIALTAALALAVTAPVAAQNTYTWQPTTNGTWNTAANWLDQTSTAGVPVSATDTSLVFNASGSTSYTATNDLGAFTLNRLTVNNTGTGTVTLAGAGALTLAGTDPTLDITGTTLFNGLFAGSGTMTMVGTGTFIHDSNNSGFTGTLVLNGGTFINRATTVATTNFNPVSIVVNSGATYQFGAATVGDPNLPNSTYITVNTGGTVNWQEGETFGGFHLQGGTINFQQGGTTNSGAVAQNWTAGTFTGGAFTMSLGANAPINKTTSGTVLVSGGVSFTGTGAINIQEGTMAFATAANLAGTNAITLGSAATAGTFEYQGLSATRAGTFGVNAGGGTIAVTDANSTLTLSGAFSGDGNLTKTGAGTLHLTGALNGTGTTTVAGGTLRVNPGTAVGGFAANGGTILAVNAGTGATTFITPTLNLANNSTVRFELNTASVPTAPLVTVSGANGLTTGGATLSLTNLLGFANGTYTLFSYTGTQITSGFTLVLPGRTAGSLDLATAGQVNAIITGTDTIKWGGQVNGTWDVGTGINAGGTNNWQLVSNNNATNFIQTDTVTFDDTASGNFTVTIGGTVQPSAVTVNNTTNNYTFTGAGGIGGSSGLTKSGTGRLTLVTNNTYSGTTTVTGGVIQVGDGGTVGSLGGGAVTLDGGAIEYNRSDAVAYANVTTIGAGGGLRNAGSGTLTVGTALAVGANALEVGGAGNSTVAGVISGTGSVTKVGAGTLTLLGGNSFTGTVTINGGTVILNDTGLGGDLNAAGIVVNNGGVFQFGDTGGNNPDLPANTVLTVNTGGTARFLIGEDYGAFNLLGGTYSSAVNNNLGQTSTLESGAITNLNGVNGSLAGGGLVQKTSAGTVTITGVALNGTGGLNIDQGVLSTDSAIGGSGIIRLGNVGPATLEYRGATATVSRAVTLDTNGGTIGVTTAGTTYTLSGVLSGNGGLTKTGTGELALNGANTYTGATAVQAGTLGGTGTVAGATSVENGGTIRGDSGTGTGTLTTRSVTVANGGRLGVQLGTGTAASRLDASATGSVLNLNSGAVIAPTGSFDGGGDRVLASIASENGALVVGGITYNTDATIATYTHNGGTGSQTFGAVQLDLANLSLANGDVLALRRSGNTLVLSFTPVPEPALLLTVAAGVAGMVGLGRRVWRKKKAD